MLAELPPWRDPAGGKTSISGVTVYDIKTLTIRCRAAAEAADAARIGELRRAVLFQPRFDAESTGGGAQPRYPNAATWAILEDG